MSGSSKTCVTVCVCVCVCVCLFVCVNATPDPMRATITSALTSLRASCPKGWSKALATEYMCEGLTTQQMRQAFSLQ